MSRPSKGWTPVGPVGAPPGPPESLRVLPESPRQLPCDFLTLTAPTTFFRGPPSSYGDGISHQHRKPNARESSPPEGA